MVGGTKFHRGILKSELWVAMSKTKQHQNLPRRKTQNPSVARSVSWQRRHGYRRLPQPLRFSKAGFVGVCGIWACVG